MYEISCKIFAKCVLHFDCKSLINKGVPLIVARLPRFNVKKIKVLQANFSLQKFCKNAKTMQVIEFKRIKSWQRACHDSLGALKSWQNRGRRATIKCAVNQWFRESWQIVANRGKSCESWHGPY